MTATTYRLRREPSELRLVATAFLVQGWTIFFVTANVHQNVGGHPLRVAALQVFIGSAWVVNLGAISRGGWPTRVAYVAGGALGAALGSVLGAAWR